MTRASPLHGGVDRNSASSRGAASIVKVAPSRGRGSKHLRHGPRVSRRGSPLHGGVDRNLLRPAIPIDPSSRPFTGAWIETRCPPNWQPPSTVAPSRGRGSKPDAVHRAPPQPESPLHGGVDRNRGARPRWRRSGGSPLHGGVDRNFRTPVHSVQMPGRPFTGAWIETRTGWRTRPSAIVAPSRGRGSDGSFRAEQLMSPTSAIAAAAGIAA